MNNGTPPNDVWYYAKDGSSFGPFTQAELLQKAAEGSVKSETLVVRQGEENWRPFLSAGIREESKSTTPQVAPPPIPASEKRQPTNKDKAVGCGCMLFIGLAFSAWVNFGSTSKEPSGHPSTTDAYAQRPYTEEDAKYIVLAARKLLNEAKVLTADEAWRPPDGFAYNPVKNWKAKAKTQHDEIFSVYHYDDSPSDDGTVRQLVVQALVNMAQGMRYFEELIAAYDPEAVNNARRLMQYEIEASNESLAKAEEALYYRRKF